MIYYDAQNCTKWLKENCTCTYKFKYKMVIKQVKNQQINTYKYNKQLIYILKHT